MACWLIKGKPSRNDLSEMLLPGRHAKWVTRKPPRAWQAGDPLLFWKAAPSLCLIGAGELLSIEDADQDGETFFLLKYLTAPLPQPVPIDVLRRDDIVGDASFLKAGAAGTVFPLTSAQAERIAELVLAANPDLPRREARSFTRLTRHLPPLTATPRTQFSPTAVLTAKARTDVDDAIKKGGSAEWRVSSRWTTAAAQLANAKQAGLEMAVLIGDASSDVGRLVAWATLDEISVDAEGTTWRCHGMGRLTGRRAEQLVKASDGSYVAPSFRRGYAVVRTPAFLVRQARALAERRSPQHAAQVVEAFIPDPVERDGLLRCLSSSIRMVAEVSPAGWGLTLFPDHLRLNIGRVEAFVLGEGAAKVAVHRDSMSNPQAALSVAEWSHGSFKALGCAVTGTVGEIAAAWRSIEPAHRAILEVVGPMDGYRWAEAHSDGVLAFIEEATGELLPRPGWPGGTVALPPHPGELLVQSATEGRALLRAHLARERDRELVRAKRADVLQKLGRLACEVCGFDFHATYGELGRHYCEVHHLKPLSSSTEERRTDLADLAVLCSNCHRMVHRRTPIVGIEELRETLGRDVRAGHVGRQDTDRPDRGHA